MASTLKPFRQYNEHEVINLFSWAPVTSGDAQGAACVSMKVFDANESLVQELWICPIDLGNGPI